MTRALSRIIGSYFCLGCVTVACSGGGTADPDTTGGSANRGGGGASSATGGAANSAGMTGGSSASGGASAATGGSAGGGTNSAKGGASSGAGATLGGTSTGGMKSAGGSSGGRSSGGTSGTGAAAGMAGGGGAARNCKRGIAANTAPAAAFFPAVAWWYNWSPKRTGTDVGIEFTPMVWGAADVNAMLPAGSKYLLTFNEPNFHAQSNLTAAQAASYWPMLEAKASALNIPLVSPGMNFCGPAADCNGTNPYQYLKDFFAVCQGCKVDYVAVHWYNCDLPSLKDYLEPGGNLEGFEQFGKPIWLTEFSCDGGATVAAQEAYMRAAVPYLNQNPHVFRYSWFSAGPIPNAKLMNADGSPTALGQVYIGLPEDCR
ncbi:MAG TPA: glycoside hydrolase family protein [Polyangiaceae bacterium]|nr:glycoside hydrolase family protein [Polyangiaceae bacterium]